MSLFTLMVVPPEWQFGLPLPVSQTTHDLWKDRLEAGTRMIFYDPAAEAVVGEGEGRGRVRAPEGVGSRHRRTKLPAWIEFADYALPVRTLYQRNLDSVIPLEEVRYALNDNSFPHSIGETARDRPPHLPTLDTGMVVNLCMAL